MTPVQLACAECANWDKGACLGAYFNDDLSHRFAKPLARCLLNDPIQRCAYFEECVLPMRIEGSDQKQITRRREHDEAIHSYRMNVKT